MTITEVLEHHRRVRDTQAILGNLGRSNFVELYDALAAAQKRIEELETALKVIWIPCEERMPDTEREVWVSPHRDPRGVRFASWDGANWWIGWQRIKRPKFTHWAEIRLPEPPSGRNEQ